MDHEHGLIMNGTSQYETCVDLFRYLGRSTLMAAITHSIPFNAFLVAVACVLSFSALAQDASGLRVLSDDLCGCLEKVDVRATDPALEYGVRNCLEDAVVYHPGTVNALIRRSHSSDPKAVILGRMLGTLLDRDCSGFRSIKVRLQQMQSTGTLRKGST
jgi:hypothetical protein